MIKSITIVTETFREKLDFKQEQKVAIDWSRFIKNEVASFDVEIEFQVPITQFRNHDYTWVDGSIDRMGNDFSPKILKLKNGIYVQSNTAHGIWEIKKKNPNKLFWRFNPKNSKPLTFYTGATNQKVIAQANSPLSFAEQPALLFSSNGAVELSRSKIPFSAIACFTDHCDFDTAENLTLQRQFFKKHDIKTTKGFFLNHFSKRDDNASYEKESEELDLWLNDGHELCYHSLSQSIKSEDESFSDFENFTPPHPEISTWIDHGYQPYNLSLYKNNKIEDAFFESVIQQKNIQTLWNYVDSGTATTNVLNQLNANQFTLFNFLRGNKNLPLLKLMQLMIKNIIFHYYADEEIITKYKSLAGNFKKVIYKKQFGTIFKVISDSFAIVVPLISVLFFWRKHKNKPFQLAKYCPIIFKHKIFEKEFFVFQTIEMVDFKKSLSNGNIDLLIAESGLFIAHTYFSVPMSYHQGKMFGRANKIDNEVDVNFTYLSQKIKENQIWNPTLNELINYLSFFETIILDVDNQGCIVVKNNPGLQYRTIS